MNSNREFLENFKELQHMIREITTLRNHNLQFTEDSLDTDLNILLFSEAALIITTFERFLRILPDLNSTDDDTLGNLLDRAFKKQNPLFDFDKSERKFWKENILRIRNSILHGNYEQATVKAAERYKDLSIVTKEDYFKKAFAKDIEHAFIILETCLKQIDPNTGRRHII